MLQQVGPAAEIPRAQIGLGHPVPQAAFSPLTYHFPPCLGQGVAFRGRIRLGIACDFSGKRIPARRALCRDLEMGKSCPPRVPRSGLC